MEPAKMGGFVTGLVLLGLMAADSVRTARGSTTETRAVDDVTIVVRETESGARLEAENLRPVPIELRIEDRGPNSEDSEPTVRIIPPLSTATLVEIVGLSRDEAVARMKDRYRFVSYMGDPAAIRPDLSHLYRLPFKPGKSYRLSQGFHGKQSHNHDGSRYAVDFQLEVGEAVHAARSGTVAKVVDWFREAGDRSRIKEANLIVVLHEDGTMAHYVHLDHGGSLVKQGDRVEVGQEIGRSGMTGFTGGPHLHFVVMRERDIAIPIRFEGHEDRDLSKPGRFRIVLSRKD